MSFDIQTPPSDVYRFRKKQYDKKIRDPGIPEIYGKGYVRDFLSRVETSRSQTVAITFIDLDLFSEINNNFGHVTGDTLIRELAIHLKDSFRPEDVFGRFGGDEFIVIEELSSPPKDQAEETEFQENTIRRIQNSLETFNEHRETKVGLSIGTAIFRPGDRILNTVKTADDRMYAMKEEHHAQMEAVEKI